MIELDSVTEPVNLSVVPGCRVVSTNIGVNGEVIRMWAPEAIADLLFATEKQPNWASFPTTHTEEPYSATVVIDGTGGSSERKLPLLSATFPMVQPLPGGELLVVAPRCQRSEDGSHELNARVFDSDGVVREFCLGDGIEHVQTNSMGQIWVGYFDEGVFGNFGWGGPDGPAPMGAEGLVCYDPAGKATWKFKPNKELDYIVDCYALNVAGDCVWACYYTDFPIIRVDGQGKVDSWQTNLRGPRELAVSGTSVLAFGGYGENSADCVLLRLGKDRAERVAEVRLRLPDFVNLRQSHVAGRGTALYVVAKDTLYMFAVPSD
jgi:hypothetical protein